MKENAPITEALISPMDGILPFRDRMSCGAAACHTERHMVWHHATSSHEHQGRSFEWAMTGTASDAAACIDYCFSIVSEVQCQLVFNCLHQSIPNTAPFNLALLLLILTKKLNVVLFSVVKGDIHEPPPLSYLRKGSENEEGQNPR